jgi:hypothetical protein
MKMTVGRIEFELSESARLVLEDARKWADEAGARRLKRIRQMQEMKE